jgi:hypothetical protein
MKTKSPSMEKQLSALQKQVTALARKLDKAEKTLARRGQPGRVRATKLVVDELEVVDANGKVVASIDKSGNLFCRTVWASTGRNTRGVFIDGVTFRSVSAASLELIGPKGNTPAVEINGWGSAGNMTLRDLETKQQLLLQGSGAPLIAHDKNARQAAMLSVNSPAGGSLKLQGTAKESKAVAQLSVSHLTSAGMLVLQDGAGKEVARLPMTTKGRAKRAARAKG